MNFWHGTSEKAAERIMREGLLPRQIHGEKSNWESAVSEDCVYMYLNGRDAVDYTSFARYQINDADMLVLKIDSTAVDPDRLMLDHEELLGLLTHDWHTKFMFENKEELANYRKRIFGKQKPIYGVNHYRDILTSWQSMSHDLRAELVEYAEGYNKRIMYHGSIMPEHLSIWHNANTMRYGEPRENDMEQVA